MKKTGKIVLAVIAAICLFNTNIVKSQNVEDLTGEQCYQLYLHYKYGVDVKRDSQKAQYYLDLSDKKFYRPPLNKGQWRYWFRLKNGSIMYYNYDPYRIEIFNDNWSDEFLTVLANIKCYSTYHVKAGKLDWNAPYRPNNTEVIKEDGELIEVNCLCTLKESAQKTLKKREEDRNEAMDLLKK